MRIFLFILIFMTTFAHAITSEMVIPKGKNIPLVSKDVFFNRKKFPQETYHSDSAYVSNSLFNKFSNNNQVTFYNSKWIAPEFNIEFVEYNPVTRRYRAEISLKDKILLFKFPVMKESNEKIIRSSLSFSSSNKMTIEGKIIPISTLSYKGNTYEKNDFSILSTIDNGLILYPNRDVKIKFESHENTT